MASVHESQNLNNVSQVCGSVGSIWETVAIVQMSCFYQAISSLWCENRTNFQKSDLPSLPSSSSQRPPRPLVSARWFKMMVHSQARRVTFPEGRNPIPALLEGLGQKVRCDWWESGRPEQTNVVIIYLFLSKRSPAALRDVLELLNPSLFFANGNSQDLYNKRCQATWTGRSTRRSWWCSWC